MCLQGFSISLKKTKESSILKVFIESCDAFKVPQIQVFWIFKVSLDPPTSPCCSSVRSISVKLHLISARKKLELERFWRFATVCVNLIGGDSVSVLFIAFFIMSHLTGSPCGSGESLVCHRDVVERIAGVKVRLHCNNGGFTRRCSMGLKKKHIYGSQKKWFNPFNIHNQESKKLAILKTLHFQSCSQ